MAELSDIQRAVNLRMAGVSYRDIGDRLGIDALEVEDMVARYLEAASAESADVRVRLDLARLDALLAGVWKLASRGDSTAVAQALKITGQRAQLLARLEDNGAVPEPELDCDSVADELAVIKFAYRQGG
ncbi:hypothetical protein CPHO_07135 [Corynebacterium phocae]|uniref:Uncharacterized protein n=1 Tax=Corynebacterium phocae TaxID=161895 RepID=A0A1L7D3W2_9CORY|nr:hypothetical protein [Corynebacterium phocae]APT92701.1 hypothetical protein CPHO_07135 [Corynebacterium phocae]KAA8723004.1 hypothetical protein F4V58_06640 [Corynebacterium phocae]